MDIINFFLSAVAWQITLQHPQKKEGDIGGEMVPENKDGQEGSLCVLIFQSLISSDTAVSHVPVAFKLHYVSD